MVNAIFGPKILGKRLGILTQIVTAMYYFFYLYISDEYLQFRKKHTIIWAINFIKIIMKVIKILAKRLISFSIRVFSMKLLVILFIRKKTFAREYFWFTLYK